MARRALVTGGTRGIGLAIAQTLRREGIEVMVCGRKEVAIPGIEAVTTDVTDAGQLRELAARAGAVDVLVNNVGGSLGGGSFTASTEAQWRGAFELNVMPAMILSQALLPGMRARGWGRIINLASLQSTRAFPDSAPYGAAKGGIVQLTRAMAQAWSAHGITCNAIGPGFFPTPLTAPVFADAARAAAHAAQTAIGRNGRLDDLWGATVFLASDASAYVTGQTLMVDGGYTAK